MYKLFFGEIDNPEYIPALPEELKITTDGNNESITLVEFGEYNIIKKPKLKNFTLEIQLWEDDTVFLNGNEPKYYIQKIEDLFLEKKICEFRLIRDRKDRLYFDTIFLCTIESMDYKETGINHFNISLQLKEYKEPTLIRQEIKQIGQTDDSGNELYIENKEQSDNRDTPKEYKVVDGDTLWDVAKFYFDDGSKYQELAELNNIKNSNLIYPGQIINLQIEV